jgi:hypothetical protein
MVPSKWSMECSKINYPASIFRLLTELGHSAYDTRGEEARLVFLTKVLPPTTHKTFVRTATKLIFLVVIHTISYNITTTVL